MLQILGQSGFGCKGDEGVLYIPQSFKTEASSDGFVSYSGYSLGEGVLPLCKNVVGIFSNPS